MSDVLSRAFADSQRSYSAAKSSVAAAVQDVLAVSAGGLPGQQRLNLTQAANQYAAFRGWCYSSIRPIAQTIAGQQIHVGRRRAKATARLNARRAAGTVATVEELQSHALLDLLADPNELLTAWGMVYSLVASLELTGRNFWWVTEADERRQILPIPVSWVTGYEGSTRYTSWKIRPPNAGQEHQIPSEEMVYFSYPDPADPHKALSPLQACAAAVDADEEIQISQVSAFRRGINPQHALILGKQAGADGSMTGATRPKLTGAQRRQLVEAVRKLYTGASKHGEPLILDAVIEDVKKLSNSPAEMDWLSSSQFLKQRITQSFGVNPIIFGEIEGANRASATAAEQHFAKFCINPKIKLISEILSAWLGPMFAADGEKLVVWIDPYVPRDDELEIRRWELVGKFGAGTVGELRKWAGLPPSDFDDMPLGQADGAAAAIESAVANLAAGKRFDSPAPRGMNGHHRQGV